jgi:hypothetical protein
MAYSGNNIRDFGSPGENFFRQNPLFKMMPECRKLIKDYGEDDASIIVWAYILIHHVKSPFHRLDNKHDIISRDFMENKFDAEILFGDEFYDLSEEIRQQCMTTAAYELSLNIDAVKKARSIVFGAGKSSEIMGYVEKAPKALSQLVTLQREADNTDKVKSNKKFAGQMAQASRPKIVSDTDNLDFSNEYD